MFNVRKLNFILLIVVVIILTTTWIIQMEKPKLPSSDMVDLSDIEALLVELTVLEGEIEIKPNNNNVIISQFIYRSPLYMPKIEFSEDKSIGTYTIQQNHLQSIGSFPTENKPNKWILQLNNQIPIDLILNMNTGSAVLDLDDLNLKSLTIKYKDAHLNIDLSAKYDQWYSEIPIKIYGQEGEIRIQVSENVGTMIRLYGDDSNIISSDLRKHEDGFANYKYGLTEGVVNIDLWTKNTKLFFSRQLN